MTRPSYTAIACLLIAGAGCVDEPPTGVAETPLEEQSASGCGITSVPDFDAMFPCFETIHVTHTGSQGHLADPIQSAAAAWNNAVEQGGVPNIAYLAPGQGTPDFTVSGGTGTGPWCAIISGGTIAIQSKAAGHCPTNWTYDLGSLLTHEFGHLLGIKDTREGYGVAGVSDHCTMYLGNRPEIPGSICAHDLERLYAGYGYPSALSAGASDYYARHIVTGLQFSPTSLTLTEGQTGSVSVATLITRHGANGSRARGSSRFTWRASGPAVSVSSTATVSTTVTAVTQGTARVTATPVASSLPSDVLLSGYMRSTPNEGINVTVNLGPRAVTDITGIEPPVTVPGTYSVTAQVSGVPAGYTAQVRWLGDTNTYDSIPPAQLRGWGSATYALSIAPGSYTLRLSAEVRMVQGTSILTGAPRSEDITVCTGALLMAGDDWTPTTEPVSNAVGGCGGGGGDDPVLP